MNILIVGNGFDLSHYLPTKYDHFMDVMKAIEEKDLTKPLSDVLYSPFDHPIYFFTKYFEIKRYLNEKTYQMSFDELFNKCRDNNFILKTKQIYQTEKILLPKEQVLNIQEMLNKNLWYRYFKNNVREAATWIDFETKIDEVLKVIYCFSYSVDNEIDKNGEFKKRVVSRKDNENEGIFIWAGYCNVLKIFEILESGYYVERVIEESPGCYFSEFINLGEPDVGGEFRYYISSDFCSTTLDMGSILSNLHTQLEEFIDIFNLYLELVIDKLEPKSEFKVEAKDWVQPDHIFSFNYTSTFQKFYRQTSTDFLHGRFGEEQNIVLGVSDLEDDSLKKLKAYGFTKYHQKLFKDTDYLFLDECSPVKKRILVSKPSAMGKGTKFLIWGHSLDQSDQEYIKEIFKLNDEGDIGVRVIVYYFDDDAKFSLLNNLLAILGKDKVEKWMKNKWLTFKENPKVELVETISEQTA